MADPDSAKDLVERIRTELLMVWSCLCYYEQWFGEEHTSERDLLESEIPGFAAFQQRLLLDQAVSGLSRLLDSAFSGRNGSNENLGFDRLIHHSNVSFPDHISGALTTLQDDWKRDVYCSVKDYRDHYVGHNDWPSKKHDDANLFYHPAVEFTHLLKELYCRSWTLLLNTHRTIFSSDLVEPKFGSIQMHPAYLVRIVSAAKAYFDLASSSEASNQWINNTFDDIEPVHGLCNKE